jgi:hypothetical protein
MKTKLVIAIILALSSPAWGALSGTTLITDARIAALKTRIANRTQPTYNAYLAMKLYVDAHQLDAVQAPAVWQVPMDDTPTSCCSSLHDQMANRINHDSVLAYKLALAYRITGNELYAQNCVRFLMGWTKITLTNYGVSALMWSNRFPNMIVAADLIKRSPRFSATQQQTFRGLVNRSLTSYSSTINGTNNQGNWGMLFVVTTAAYLQNQTLFNQAVARWKFFIENQITNTGVMRFEVTRGNMGVWYTDFALQAQTVAGEVMKVNGVDLYNYVSPSGHTLKSAYIKAAYWTRNPCAFPYYNCPNPPWPYVIGYMEILNLKWPNADAAANLTRYRPLDEAFSFPVMTLTHGELPPTPAPSPTPTPGGNPPTDFNRDGKPDYLLYNPGTRQTVVWYLNNNVFIGGAFAPTLPVGWRVIDVADFNRDGRPDYALFNASTRQTAIWYLSGVNGVTINGSALGPTPPAGWALVATGDFNRDGKPDYVLYNPSSHQTVIWYLNNNVRIASAVGPTLPGDWTVVGVADFNRDGKPDYLLFNPSTHTSVIWYLSGATRIGSAFGPTIAAGYNLVGTSDFNRDGKPDYLLFNPSTRGTAIWYLNNNVRIATAVGPTLAAGYTLAAP